jgi:hypothetical protein
MIQLRLVLLRGVSALTGQGAFYFLAQPSQAALADAAGIV